VGRGLARRRAGASDRGPAVRDRPGEGGARGIIAVVSKEWNSVEAARARAQREFGPAWPAVLEAREKLRREPELRSPDAARLAAEGAAALAAEAKSKLTEAAALVAGSKVGAELASMAGAVGTLARRAERHATTIRLASTTFRQLHAGDLRMAGVRGPTRRGRVGNTFDSDEVEAHKRELGGLRRDLVRLARLEAAGRTLESHERAPVDLPTSQTTWAVAGIALGSDPPCTTRAEFDVLCRDRWRQVVAEALQ
jgi:hypothetical protein